MTSFRGLHGGQAIGMVSPIPAGFLGHVLSLRETSSNAAWETWNDLEVLELDRELWIATSRTKRDSGGKRLTDAETTDYDYVNWSKEDYEALIDAGMNVFGLVPEIEAWLRAQPVFYRRGYVRGPAVELARRFLPL